MRPSALSGMFADSRVSFELPVGIFVRATPESSIRARALHRQPPALALWLFLIRRTVGHCVGWFAPHPGALRTRVPTFV
jgi:hypothetical protein